MEHYASIKLRWPLVLGLVQLSSQDQAMRTRNYNRNSLNKWFRWMNKSVSVVRTRTSHVCSHWAVKMKTRKFVRTLIHNLAAFPCQQLSRANPINLTREKGANEATKKKSQSKLNWMKSVWNGKTDRNQLGGKKTRDENCAVAFPKAHVHTCHLEIHLAEVPD